MKIDKKLEEILLNKDDGLDHLSSSKETPLRKDAFEKSDDEKISLIKDKFKDILHILGMDLTDDSIKGTPNRVAKMYVNEIFWGLDYAAFPKVTVVDNKMQYNEMVVEKGISVQSYCEHHLVNIDGLATVGYIPNNKVLGLSKMNRVVEFFSRRISLVDKSITSAVFARLSIANDCLVSRRNTINSNKLAGFFSIYISIFNQEIQLKIYFIVRKWESKNHNTLIIFFINLIDLKIFLF